MSKFGDSLLKAAEEALAYAKGNKKESKTHKVWVPKQIDVRAIRIETHKTRAEFAEMFGFSERTLEKWEQGVRQPDTSARAYLTVIKNNPKAVEDALLETTARASQSCHKKVARTCVTAKKSSKSSLKKTFNKE